MIAYFKLLDLLNRKNIGKEEFRKKVGISSGTMAKIGKNEYISLEVIDKICIYLNCQPGDIMECIIRKKCEKDTIVQITPQLNKNDYVVFSPKGTEDDPEAHEYRLYMEYEKQIKKE